jgi:ribosomal protein L40E
LTALVVGTVLALGALSFVLLPLLIGHPPPGDSGSSAIRLNDDTETQAVDALREIEFDRATGKLSDADYDSLKASYTQRAISAMRSAGSRVCEKCGARPETDARFCSRCGTALD